MGFFFEANMFKQALIKWIHSYQSDFNEEKYWRRRLYLQNKGGLKSKYYVIYCRRIEAKKNATTGIGLPGNCCKIKGKIWFPHGLCGIVIARNVRIGLGVTIFQHVTIAESNKYKYTIIQDNVVIGAGAVILNNVTIGKDAKIGANAVVICDVPDGATAVGVPARIIKK